MTKCILQLWTRYCNVPVKSDYSPICCPDGIPCWCKLVSFTTVQKLLCSVHGICVNAKYSEAGLRHYIPLGQRASHLCVYKEGLKLSFALDIDDASTRTHVAKGQKDTTCLLSHLEGEPHG